MQSSNNPNAPKAHLNVLFFDDKMELIPLASAIAQVPVIPQGGSIGGFFTLTPAAAGQSGTSACCVSTGPGYVIIYVDNQTIGKDVWFDNLAVEHYTAGVQEESHYYPFGLTLQMDAAANAAEQPYKYNGKELEKSFGMEMYDYGARQYNSQIGRWNGIDPLAELMRRYSPYNYAFDNPVRFIDPDGRSPEIYIDPPKSSKPITSLQGATSAAQAQNATAQLDAGTSLSITRDPITGKLSATGTAVTAVDKRIKQAINDPTINVNLVSSDSKGFVGGAFMGNQVDKGTLPGEFDNTITAIQFINPEVLKAVDDYYGTPGMGIVHEAVEAYEGAATSKQTGISALNSSIDPTFYNAAHKAADALGATQGGPIYEDTYDASGNPTNNKANITKYVYSVDDGKKPSVIIQTSP